MAYTDGPQASSTGTVRFEVISEAWQKLSANMTPWILAALIFFALTGAAYVGYYFTIFTAAFATVAASGGNEPGVGANLFLQLIGLVAGIVIEMVYLVLLAGMVKMALKQLRGQAIAPGDVFSGTSHIVPLALGGLLYGLGVVIGSVLCVIPGLLVAGLGLLMIPLIVDQNMDGVTALTTSIKTLQPHMWMALLFSIVLSLVGGLGGVACGLGMLITFPLVIISLALLYRDFYPERFQESAQQDL